MLEKLHPCIPPIFIILVHLKKFPIIQHPYHRITILYQPNRRTPVDQTETPLSVEQVYVCRSNKLFDLRTVAASTVANAQSMLVFNHTRSLQ